MTRVLVTGLPRSGTSWAGRVIGRAEGAVFVHEPDGDHEAFAIRAKRGRGRYTVVAPGDDAPEYGRLWEGAFSGGDRFPSVRARAAERLFESSTLRERAAARRGEPSPARLRLALALAVPPGPVRDARHVVVKSVHAALALEWIAAHCAPRIVVVERDPRNVVGSWIEHGIGADRIENAALADVARERFGVDAPPADAPRVVQRAFVFGVLSAAMRDAASRHPEWIVVSHDDLCVEPRAKFAPVFADLGLVWGAGVDDYLATSDVEGAGFRTKRVTAEQPGNWRERLGADDVEQLLAELARFPYDLAAVRGNG